MGNVDVVGGGANVLILAISEDVDADDVGLGMAVLSSLGGADISNFARAAVDHNVTSFADKTRLHGKRGGGTGISGVDGKVLILRWYLLVRHGAKAVTETLANALSKDALRSSCAGNHLPSSAPSKPAQGERIGDRVSQREGGGQQRTPSVCECPAPRVACGSITRKEQTPVRA